MSSPRTPRPADADVSELPTLPQLAFQLLEACERSNASLADATNLIRLDPGLAARALALAANPVHARRRPARPVSLEQAILLLGPDMMRTLAHTAAVDQHISHGATPAEWLRRLWIESLQAAKLAERLAEVAGYPAGREAYLAGLLSRIGKLGLLAHAPTEYPQLLEQAYESAEELMRLEATVLGIEHATLGARMLHKAGCAGPLTDAVRHQHADAAALDNAHPLVRVIALANLLVQVGYAPATPARTDADHMLGLTSDQLEQAYATASERTQRIVRKFDLADEANDFRQACAPAALPLTQRLGDLHLAAVIREQFTGAKDIDALCRSAHLAGSLLFGNPTAGFLLVHDDPSWAVGRSATDPRDRWSEFMLRLPNERSRAGNALCTGKPHEYYPWHDTAADAPQPAVVDLEFTSLLGREGFVALPLSFRGTQEGVMLIGVDRGDEARLIARRTLLELFARELGAAVARLARRPEPHSVALAEQEAEFQLRARHVAHEIQAPLATLQGHLRTLASRAEGAYPAAGMCIIDREIARVGTLLRRLTEPTHPPQPPDQDTRLNEVIEEVVGILKPTLITPARIGVELSLDAAIPEIAIPHGSVRQILLNLVRNAAEALTAGQCISIHTEDYVYNGKKACVGFGVADNGPGIPPHVLAAIFEPVTNGNGEGNTGVGLSVTKQLIDRMGGHISCRSSTRGTRFQVLLPRILPGLYDEEMLAVESPRSLLRSHA